MTTDANSGRRRHFGLYYYFALVAFGLALLGVYVATSSEITDLQEQIQKHSLQFSLGNYDEYGRQVHTPEELSSMRITSSLQDQLNPLWQRNEVVGIIAGIWVLLMCASLMSSFVLAIDKSLASRPKRQSVKRDDTKDLQEIGQALIKKGRDALRPSAIGSGNLSRADELRKWSQLRDDGLITEEEFARARNDILGK